MADMKEIEEILVRTNMAVDRLAKGVEESRLENEKRAAETALLIAKMEEDRQELRSIVGGWGLRLGTVVEMVVIPGIRPLLKKHGHEYDRVASNKAVKDSRGCLVAEVDVLLDNGAEAMAVEIKTCPSTGMVDKHINRLKQIRANEENAGVKGKILYGAMAGVIIEPHVQRYALNNGLYFVEIIDDEDRLEVVAPETVGRF